MLICKDVQLLQFEESLKGATLVLLELHGKSLHALILHIIEQWTQAQQHTITCLRKRWHCTHQTNQIAGFPCRQARGEYRAGWAARSGTSTWLVCQTMSVTSQQAPRSWYCAVIFGALSSEEQDCSAKERKTNKHRCLNGFQITKQMNCAYVADGPRGPSYK